MIKKAYYYYLLLCFITLLGCTSEQILYPVDYVKWVKATDNGLKKIKEMSHYAFEVQYKPLDFIVAQEEKTNDLAEDILVKRKEELGEDYYYYNLRIKSLEGNLSPIGAGVGTNQQYNQRLSYFTFDMQEDLYLLEGQDTLPCTMYQFVRNYDVAPFVEFALGFKKKKKGPIQEDLTFVLEDRILGIGSTRIIFEEQVLNNTPKIKTL